MDPATTFDPTLWILEESKILYELTGIKLMCYLVERAKITDTSGKIDMHKLLLFAANRGDLGLVEYLINNKKIRQCCDIALLAMVQDDVKLMEIILQSKIEENFAYRADVCLIEAAKRGNLRLVKFFLNYEEKNPHDIRQYLCRAMGAKHHELSEYLITKLIECVEKNCSDYGTDRSNYTFGIVMMDACYFDDLAIVKRVIPFLKNDVLIAARGALGEVMRENNSYSRRIKDFLNEYLASE